MSSYKLYYANARGRAEVARLIFAVADVAYEDVRMTPEEWQEFKSKTPFGQMPVLEVDGVMIAQSFTIYRFLAKRFGLTGKTDVEAARADMIGCAVIDLGDTILKIYDADTTQKALPATSFEKLEQLLISNGGGDGFFVGDGLTWSDIAFAGHIDYVSRVAGTDVPWDKLPKLKALKERVEVVPKIAEWIKNRPKTEM